jgi:hypothetical protein
MRSLALTLCQIQTLNLPFLIEAMALVAVAFGSSRGDASIADAFANVSSNPTLSKAHENSPQTLDSQHNTTRTHAPLAAMSSEQPKQRHVNHLVTISCNDIARPSSVETRD